MRRCAFTLIEVLVTAALVAMLLGSLLRLFRLGVSTARRVDHWTETADDEGWRWRVTVARGDLVMTEVATGAHRVLAREVSSARFHRVDALTGMVYLTLEVPDRERSRRYRTAFYARNARREVVR